MSSSIIRFPISKRKFSLLEEKEIRICVNKIHNIYSDTNPFITDEMKKEESEMVLEQMIKIILELNEEQ